MEVPKPPSAPAFRTISECRVRAIMNLFDGKSKLKIYSHKSDMIGKTTYFIESVNKKPAIVTYVNSKRVDVREIDI
jgi:hypothetical protein